MFNLKPKWSAGGWTLHCVQASSPADAGSAEDTTEISVVVEPPRETAIVSGPVWSHHSDGSVVLTLPGLGSATIHGGNRVIITPAPDADAETWQLLIEGPVLAVLQRQRGLLPLDGAAVGWRDGALLIVGPSGQGKSSLAAAMAIRGFPFLADGVLGVDVSNNRLAQGAKQLRLWRRPAEALGIDLTASRPVRQGVARMDLDWLSDVSDAPWPINGIVLVSERMDTPSCIPISAAGGAAWLMASLWARLAFDDDAALLAQAVALVSRVPCWKLAPAQGVKHLAETASSIATALT